MPSTGQKLVAWSFLAIVVCVPVVQTVLDFRLRGTPQFVELFLKAPTEENLRRFESELEDNSWFEEWLGRLVRNASFTVFKDSGAKVVRGKEWLFFKPGIRYLVDRADDKQLDEVVRAIEHFQGQLQSRGIQLLVVPVPGKASVHPQRLTHRPSPNHWRTARLLQRLQQLQIPTLDLLPKFQPPESSLYMVNDTHWRPQAITIAAQAIAEKVAGLGLTLPKRVSADWQLQNKSVRRIGDLATMANLDKRPGDWHEVVSTQQVRYRGLPAAASDSSPILLLGDSFCRVFETDQPSSAGLPSHLAYHLGIPLTTIVNDGGASTLVRQQLARRSHLLDGKKLVIWEFVERDIRFGTEGWQEVPVP